jgi:hypothetical protein
VVSSYDSSPPMCAHSSTSASTTAGDAGDHDIEDIGDP